MYGVDEDVGVGSGTRAEAGAGANTAVGAEFWISEEATPNVSAVPPAGGQPRLVQGLLTGQQQANTSSDSSCDGRLPPQAKLDGTRQWANRGAAPKRVSCLRGACQPTSQERITELVYNRAQMAS